MVSGVNTALFSIVKHLLFERLPYQDSDRLVYVTEYWPHEPAVPGPPSPDFANWRDHSELADGIAGYGSAGALSMTGLGDPERVEGTFITSSLLEILGVKMAVGRNFTPAEDRPGQIQVAILGYSLWQRKFGASPNVLGETIRLNGIVRTIIGVLPSNFAFPDNNFQPELLIPMALAGDLSWRDERGFRLLRVLVRMRAGINPTAVRDEFISLVRRTASKEPQQMVTMRKDMEVRVIPLREWLTAPVKRTLYVLQAAVGMLLLIACLNIASLQVARTTARRSEMALRAAIGAGVGRLVRQLLTESVLLCGCGGVLGVALGYMLLGPLRAFLPSNLHLADSVRLDFTVLAFATVATLLTGALAGVAPALAGIKESLRAGLKKEKPFIQDSLVIAETAIAIMLLVGSGFFIQTFIKLASVDPGFRPEGVLTARISLPPRYDGVNAWNEFFDRLLERIHAIPGVEMAAVSNGLPVVGTIAASGMGIEGQSSVPLGGRPSIPSMGASPDYFHALGIPIIRGRQFTVADDSGPLVAIVSKSLADRYFGEGALGKKIEVGTRDGLWREIVGIAGDGVQPSRRAANASVIYMPLHQAPQPEAPLIVQSRISAGQLIAGMRAAVKTGDPSLPVYDVATMEERLQDTFAPQRANMTLMVIFALLGLVLSATGIFGVIAYLVNRRQQEMGIRQALGATRAQIMQMVLRKGMTMATAGIAIGLAGATLLSRYAASLIESTPNSNAIAYVGAVAVFLTVAYLACAIPARAASRVDPMIALRHD